MRTGHGAGWGGKGAHACWALGRVRMHAGCGGGEAHAHWASGRGGARACMVGMGWGGVGHGTACYLGMGRV